MKLTTTQRSVLDRMALGQVLYERIVPLSPFRTLGAKVPAERRYEFQIVPRRVRYETFRSLFKRNLIRPLRAEAGASVTLFVLTHLGQRAVA